MCARLNSFAAAVTCSSLRKTLPPRDHLRYRYTGLRYPNSSDKGHQAAKERTRQDGPVTFFYCL
jgi:hypothetical protein